MKLINKNEYLLKSGKVISPYCGIIGISESDMDKEQLIIYEGYDGTIFDEIVDSDAGLTKKELKEIALYMSKLWENFAKLL